ncbi:MAG: inositol monophosphatase family protein [Nitrososphaeraceae archaeon]
MVPLEILREACFNVYEITRKLIGTEEGNQRLGIGAGGDWSRKIDIESEKAIIRTVQEHGMSPTFIGEECGKIPGREGYLIIDPIDGTTNATSGLPFYCCSLAYATKYRLSSVSHATIMDLSRGEIYAASKGRGAWLNDVKLEVGYKKRQDDELIIGMNISRTSLDDLSILSKIIGIAEHVRLLGANALELCYLAKGSLDAYIDLRGKIRATDIAAAFLIVNEAGGIIYSTLDEVLDSELGVDSRMSYIAFSNHNLHDIVFEALSARK